MEDGQIFTECHAKSILTTMNTLRKTDTLCDVTLKVAGQEFAAHRIVLAACSDYFCAMFTNEVLYIQISFHKLCFSLKLLGWLFWNEWEFNIEEIPMWFAF